MGKEEEEEENAYCDSGDYHRPFARWSVGVGIVVSFHGF